MPEKTSLMEKYEKEHPGKHAIWRGNITKQFKEWKEQYKEVQKAPLEELPPKELIGFEVVLYLSISKLREPTYTKIMEFCSSFGMKSQDIINIVLKKIKQGDISYTKPKEPKLAKILDTLLEMEKLDLPLTIRISEALNIFNNMNFEQPIELVNHFKSIKKSYPNFISMSSSQLDKQEDLITFKRLFPEEITFKLSKRWLINE